MNRLREEGSKRATVGVLDQAELKSKAKRPWVQAPDLSTLLKNYVENPNLRVGQGGVAAAPSKSVS
ncbi:hypothetical protein AGABI2DRAFT_191205 [Agaricus bisporus var. bisporus H97]|uniref:hypothetical protein n=1 Tax=Agaricus bisporus var. bisporus (strain H97 / ATCC MYA-4626 / FGSC 10389) TaxID=936046 RepID=UPI00029F6EBD|nr:hypothetical protein AGABI2DRAFT_191205 [Agaricus bisporus var. bisporus H97]EKV49067.1 hypothetical protein AGABI2DRAFT_191205 [Agaricus bisporus var. bisporus H97]